MEEQNNPEFTGKDLKDYLNKVRVGDLETLPITIEVDVIRNYKLAPIRPNPLIVEEEKENE